MDSMLIEGGPKLMGEVAVSGAKNSVLPLMFSTLLADGEHTLTNVPSLMDVRSSRELLEALGCETHYENETLRIIVKAPKQKEAHYDIVRKMRASILCLGPLLAKYGEARVSLPGGCAIGSRPINLHLEAMKSLGAEVQVEKGYVVAKAKNGLKGDRILFDTATVGGTENLLMAAALAEGTTIIENAAKEPEIVDLADYLNKMGAKITGAGTSIVTIVGVESLSPSQHEVIPDRIEAGTLLIAGAITGGHVKVNRCRPDHIKALIDKMQECGYRIEHDQNSVTIYESAEVHGVDVTTSPHPGFPTDLQAQFMALMTQANGTSVITESVFENRFMHVQELNRMSADITPKTRVAVVRGKKGFLHGAPVMATDLRASACLVLAGLVAEGETHVNRIYHLDRGYFELEKKLSSIGAKITRVRG